MMCRAIPNNYGGAYRGGGGGTYRGGGGKHNWLDGVLAN